MSDEKPAVEALASSVTFVPGEKPGSVGSAPQTTDEVDAAVRKQIEFYFCDANFKMDKFLQAESAKSKEQWVDLATIASFNRMKALVPSLDLSAIARALKPSTEVEVSEEQDKVRRATSRWQHTLGGVTYTTREDVVTYARSLIAEGSAVEGGALSEEAQKFVTDLLAHHANPAEKTGPGIQSVKVGFNPEFPDTKCFVLVRNDGTEVDFSYLKCIEKIFPKLEGGKGRGGPSNNKRKLEDAGGSPAAKRGPAADAAASSSEPLEPFTKGCLLVIKDLAEGSTIHGLKAKFVEAVGETGAPPARHAACGVHPLSAGALAGGYLSPCARTRHPHTPPPHVCPIPCPIPCPMPCPIAQSSVRLLQACASLWISWTTHRSHTCVSAARRPQRRVWRWREWGRSLSSRGTMRSSTGRS